MDKIYVVLKHGEVDSVYRDPNKASSQVANLCRFEFDNVIYDMNGLAESESGSLKVVETFIQD